MTEYIWVERETPPRELTYTCKDCGTVVHNQCLKYFADNFTTDIICRDQLGHEGVCSWVHNSKTEHSNLDCVWVSYRKLEKENEQLKQENERLNNVIKENTAMSEETKETKTEETTESVKPFSVEDLVGLTNEAAEDAAKKAGLTTRLMGKDGEELMGDMQYLVSRVSIWLKNNIVSSVKLG